MNTQNLIVPKRNRFGINTCATSHPTTLLSAEGGVQRVGVRPAHSLFCASNAAEFGSLQFPNDNCGHPLPLLGGGLY